MSGEPANDINNGYIHIKNMEIPFSQRVIHGKIKLTLPTNFEQMEKRFVAVKYPAYNSKNAIVLTNEETTINFMFNFKDGYIEPEQLDELRDQMLEVLTDAHPSLVFLEKSAIGAGGLRAAYFEIVTPSLDEDIYNFMAFFIVDENLVIAAFNCFDDEKDDWRPVIRQVMESLQIV